MTERGEQLYATADGQIAELIGLTSTLDDVTLRLPCPGRKKLGDGTIAACVRHTADNYQRIAAFVQTSDRVSGAHPTQPGGQPIPRFDRPADHTEHGARADQHDDQYTAGSIDRDALIKQLTASRETLSRVAVLTDSQLDAIPPKDSFRFCDGQRTLEQVLAGVLKHQSHQLDALRAVTSSQPGAD